MIYPYKCKACNRISTVNKPIKLKARFEYCEHCESKEPLVTIDTEKTIENNPSDIVIPKGLGKGAKPTVKSGCGSTLKTDLRYIAMALFPDLLF